MFTGHILLDSSVHRLLSGNINVFVLPRIIYGCVMDLYLFYFWWFLLLNDIFCILCLSPDSYFKDVK